MNQIEKLNSQFDPPGCAHWWEQAFSLRILSGAILNFKRPLVPQSSQARRTQQQQEGVALRGVWKEADLESQAPGTRQSRSSWGERVCMLLLPENLLHQVQPVDPRRVEAYRLEYY